MGKLMRYEFRKTWFTKAILLGVTALLEALFLIGLYGEYSSMLGTSALFLFLLAFFGVLVIGLESVITLHRDVNTKQSYMLFMTPNSCYKILGAKTLECSISVLLTGAFYFALGALDIMLIFAKEGELSEMWRMIRQFLTQITVEGRALSLNMQMFGSLAFSMLCGWIFTVTTAYLAVVISSALLNGKKLNGFISFILFLAITTAVSRLMSVCLRSVSDTITLLLVEGGISLVIAGIMYYLTARIMEDRLSV